jgi:Flp pilus assembly protein TadG
MVTSISSKRPPTTASHRGRRAGVAAVELALVLPLLLLIVLGCVDFSRFAYTGISVTNAGRTGAGFGAVNPYTTATQAAWQTQVRAKVLEDLRSVTGGTATQEASVQVSTTRTVDADGLWRVRVEVSYPFATLVPWPGIPSSMTVKRAAEMRGIR